MFFLVYRNGSSYSQLAVKRCLHTALSYRPFYYLASAFCQYHAHFQGRRESRGPRGKDFTREGRPKFGNLIIICSRRGNKLTVLVLRVYTRVEVFLYTNHPLLKALLIILPKVH